MTIGFEINMQSCSPCVGNMQIDGQPFISCESQEFKGNILRTQCEVNTHAMV